MWTQNDVKITKYGISVQVHRLKFCRVDVLQELHINYSDIGYDVTIATYLVPVLYFPKMKNVLIVGPEYNRPSFACAL